MRKVAGEHRPPLIVHVVYRFGIGGLENGVVNLLNRLPADRIRHAVVSLTTIDPAFVARITRPDVELIEIRKPPGQTLRAYLSVYRALRRLRPHIVHTRNIAALECQPVAWLAGVPARIHGEHGWDLGDLHGSNAEYLRLRRLLRRFVHHQVSLSARTHRYLLDSVKVPPPAISRICNGVDTSRFVPAEGKPRDRAIGWPFEADSFVIGTVGRLSGVKNQQLLCEGFIRLAGADPAFRRRGRLAIIGGGPDEPALRRIIDEAGLRNSAWFAGERDDVTRLLPGMDIFCLTSLAEGISNAILEAMSCGLPVLTTDVGGNAELVEHGRTGHLLQTLSPSALAEVLGEYFHDAERCLRQGRAARERAVTEFSLERMVDRYWSLYSRLLGIATPTAFSG